MKNLSKKFIFLVYAVMGIALVFFAMNTFYNYLGLKAFKKGEYEKARKYFLNFFVGNKEMIGKTYYQQNRFEEAFNYYKKTNDLDGIGFAFLGLKNYEKAVEYFEKTKNDYGKGLALLGEKKYKEALKLFESINDKRGIGLAYLAMGNLDKAEEAFRDAGDYFGLGIVLLSKGERVAAIKAFQQSNSEIAKGMASYLRGNIEKAKEYFSKKPDWVVSGFFNMMIGHYEKAEEIFVYSKDEDKLGWLFLRTGRYAESYEKFVSASDYNGLGELFFEVKDYERAFEYFKKSKNYKRAFDSLVALGNFDKAVEFAQEIIRKEITYPEIQLSLAELYRKEGKYEFSIRELEKIEKNEAYKDLSLIYKARSYFSGKEYQKVSDILKSLQKIYEDPLWKTSIDLSALDLNEISGKELVSVSTKKQLAKEEILRKETVELKKTGKSKGNFIYIIIVVVIIGVSVFVFIYLKRKTPAHSERKSLISGGKKGASADFDEDVNVPEVLGVKDSEFNGAEVLINVMKKEGIETNSEEITDLSGETGKKLTVYGIYLASRAKGIAVKGVKIDYEYLKEIKSPVIAFFKDETFANVVSVDEKKITLDYGIGRLITIPKSKFMEIWNEYVMIFGVA